MPGSSLYSTLDVWELDRASSRTFRAISLSASLWLTDLQLAARRGLTLATYCLHFSGLYLENDLLECSSLVENQLASSFFSNRLPQWEETSLCSGGEMLRGLYLPPSRSGDPRSHTVAQLLPLTLICVHQRCWCTSFSALYLQPQPCCLTTPHLSPVDAPLSPPILMCSSSQNHMQGQERLTES